MVQSQAGLWLTPHEYPHLLGNSVFTLAPQNAGVDGEESHRMFEALEQGSMPVLSRTPASGRPPGAWLGLAERSPLVFVNTFAELETVARRLLALTPAQLNSLQVRARRHAAAI